MNSQEEKIVLVLARKAHESIIIGENGDIQITIIKVKGGRVKIGIEAPGRIPVHRKELLDGTKTKTPSFHP